MYGTVCTVVWEVGANSPSYPIYKNLRKMHYITLYPVGKIW